ncbi:MAG TPA: hypothetical protein VH595_11300 [Verrucomicrobiae bacterium]|jgi:hypothetical protein|nr:hypothetical protein [Verrucomicrobiae bacterium]
MQPSVFLTRLIGLGAVFVAVPLSVHAQVNPNDDWNHFGLNFRAGFNIGAKFSEPSGSGPFGGGGAIPPGPSAGPDVNRRYNDGYVNVDSSGNGGGQTWNWGYDHPSQVSGQDLLMHANGPIEGGATGRTTDDPNLGIDFSYIRDIGHYKWGQWGIKFAFGYTPVEINDNDPIGVTAENITDTYLLGSVVAPTPPYTGSFNGPGPLLGSQPISRSTSMGTEEITGNHRLDAALYDWRVGPSFNILLAKRLSLQAGGGFALGLVDSDFTFNENILTSSGRVSASGGSTSTGLLPGAYAEAGLAYRFSHSMSVYGGAQFETLGNFHQTADGRTACLDFSDMLFFELGLEFHF